MPGSVRLTVRASGAAKLLQAWETASCSAASGRQASQPAAALPSRMDQGMGASSPMPLPVRTSAAANRTWVAASSRAAIVNLARYTEEHGTGRASSAFQPPSACS
ncbi:hypothetical protein D3C73_1096890 [compost metagenome]